MEEKQKIKLPDDFIKQLIETPENGMGYHIVDLHFKNGEVLKNQIVKNSSILILENTIKLDINEIELIKISNV